MRLTPLRRTAAVAGAALALVLSGASSASAATDPNIFLAHNQVSKGITAANFINGPEAKPACEAFTKQYKVGPDQDVWVFVVTDDNVTIQTLDITFKEGIVKSPAPKGADYQAIRPGPGTASFIVPAGRELVDGQGIADVDVKNHQAFFNLTTTCPGKPTPKPSISASASTPAPTSPSAPPAPTLPVTVTA